jgi:hypothetical protein
MSDPRRRLPARSRAPEPEPTHDDRVWVLDLHDIEDRFSAADRWARFAKPELPPVVMTRRLDVYGRPIPDDVRLDFDDE